MKHGSLRILTLLAALLMLAALTAGASAQADADALIDWGKANGMTARALTKVSREDDSTMRFADKQAFSAAVSNAAADSAASFSTGNWSHGIVSMRLTDEDERSQLATLLMIKRDLVVLATDGGFFNDFVASGEKAGYDADSVIGAIAERTTVLMPDGQGGYYEFEKPTLFLSARLPLTYILLQVDQDLGEETAGEPEAASQECAGYYRNADTGEIGAVGDRLIYADGARYSLDSGTPFIEGSPIYAVDSAAGRFLTPAIGVQASDGYVYAAKPALDSLFEEAGARDDSEPTPEPTAEPTPEPTAEPTPEPDGAATGEDAQEPTEAPTEAPTDAPTEAPTEPPVVGPTDGGGDKGDGGSGVSIKDEVKYGLLGLAVVIAAALVVRSRRRKAAGAAKRQPAGDAVGIDPVMPGADDAARTVEAGETQSVEAVAEKRSSVFLRGVSGPLAGAVFPLTGRAVIGRDKRRCGIIFPEDTPGVSAVHCSVTPAPAGDALILTDEGSSRGTFVGGRKLAQGMPVTLRDGVTFELGGSANGFRIEIR